MYPQKHILSKCKWQIRTAGPHSNTVILAYLWENKTYGACCLRLLGSTNNIEWAASMASTGEPCAGHAKLWVLRRKEETLGCEFNVRELMYLVQNTQPTDVHHIPYYTRVFA